jgi:hypothetical protein
VIKYQPTNQKDDDSIINEISVFTFAIVKTESKLNCKKRDTCPLAQCDNDLSWYRKGCRQLLRVIEKNWVGCQQWRHTGRSSYLCGSNEFRSEMSKNSNTKQQTEKLYFIIINHLFSAKFKRCKPITVLKISKP